MVDLVVQKCIVFPNRFTTFKTVRSNAVRALLDGAVQVAAQVVLLRDV